jgi:hypothetical protein
MEEDNKAKKDHLMSYIESTEPEKQNVDTNTEYFGDNVKKRISADEFKKTYATDTWNNIPLSVLPFGKFYKDGTKISIRPLNTKEIQSFAIVNEDNEWDVAVKLNEVFKSCVKVEFLDGSFGSYKDLQYGDRQTIAIALSKISAKKGRKMTQKAKNANGDEIEIEMIPANYVYKEQEDWLEEFFNKDTKVYEFINPVNNQIVKLAPPTVGLTEDVNAYVFSISLKSEGKEFPNFSFIKCIPYIKAGLGVKSISLEQMEQEAYNFSKMNDDLFQVVDDAIDYINFGVEKVQMTLDNGEVVQAPFRYPEGARALFVVPNAFRTFVGK